MSEIKITLQNKSNIDFQGLQELPNKIAAKVSTISFDKLNLFVESINIVIDAPQETIKDSIKLADKKISPI